MFGCICAHVYIKPETVFRFPLNSVRAVGKVGLVPQHGGFGASMFAAGAVGAVPDPAR